MEALHEDSINFKNISEINTDDLFPQDFFYPKQSKLNPEMKKYIFDNYNAKKSQLHNIQSKNAKKNESIYSNINTNNNINNINASNINKKDNKDNDNERCLSRVINDPLIIKKEFNIKKSNVLKIINKRNTAINDVQVGFDNLIFCCGDKIAKVFYYNIEFKKEKTIFQLDDENEKFNCLAFTEFFTYFKQEQAHAIPFVNAYDTTNVNELLEKLKLKKKKYVDKEVFLLAFAGYSTIVRIIEVSIVEDHKTKLKLYRFKEHTSLIGHKNEIYDMKFHPYNQQILFTSSKDFSIRVWNALKNMQLLIIGGPQSHFAEVLSIDIHEDGNLLVSGGIDCKIKVWDLTIKDVASKINSSLEETLKTDLNFVSKYPISVKPLIKEPIIFTCNQVHSNYIDCVKFNGNFIISKSVDGSIIEWFPNFSSIGSKYYIVNIYNFNFTENLWYLKFGLSSNKDWLGVGNNLGEIFVFKIVDSIYFDKDYEENDTSKKVKRDIFRVKECNHYDTQCISVIRKVAFHEDMKFMVACNDDGNLFINSLNSVKTDNK